MNKIKFSYTLLIMFFSFFGATQAMDDDRDTTVDDNTTHVKNQMKRSSTDSPKEEPNNKKQKSEFSNLKNISEAFLIDSIKKLTDTNTKFFSKRLKTNAELYLCDNTCFDDLFPISPIGSFELSTDKGPFAGQIRITDDDEGLGSGTLVGMKEEDNGNITITGITALHNFVGFDTKGINIPLPGDRKFVMGNQSLEEGLGFAEINKVMLSSMPLKDICLFEGTFSCNKDLFEDNKKFFNQFFPHIPAIVENELINKNTDLATMYHYPLGKKNQRKNTGDAYGTGLHKVESLWGSSGASFFNNDLKIFGIHTGASFTSLSTDAVVEYNGIEDIPVTQYNSFEKVSIKDYNDALNGTELLRGNLSKEFKKQLSVLVESMSKKY